MTSDPTTQINYARTAKHQVVALCFAVVMILSGCGSSQVADNLSQKESNEIVAALNDHGISAVSQKERGGRGRFSVLVSASEFGTAVSILNKNNLPGEPKVTLAELITPSGFVPNSREIEALRLDHAVAIELEELISSLPAVASAKVIVRLNMQRQGEAPAVSASITTRRGATLNAEEVRQIIVRAVPGTKESNVSLSLAEPHEREVLGEGVIGIQNQNGAITRVPLSTLLGVWSVAERDRTSMLAVLAGIVLLVCAMAGAVGFWFGNSLRGKGHQTIHRSAPMGDSASRAIRIERQPHRELPE